MVQFMVIDFAQIFEEVALFYVIYYVAVLRLLYAL